MIPFMERFRELAARETRSVTVAGRTEIPDGEYAFVEFFCDEPACDCCRVMIVVLKSDTGWSKIWASINYGWESLDFYKRWGGPWVTDSVNPQEEEFEWPSPCRKCPESSVSMGFACPIPTQP